MVNYKKLEKAHFVFLGCVDGPGLAEIKISGGAFSFEAAEKMAKEILEVNLGLDVVWIARIYGGVRRKQE